METKGKNNNENQRPRTNLGFCLPFPGFGEPATTHFDKTLNPFPLISDLGSAYTVLPIKTFFFPIDFKTIGDHFTLASHESVHLSLVDTTLSTYIILLLNFQYMALRDSLAGGKAVSVPSLKEPTNVFLQAQNTLDLVETQVSFIHELMAVTLGQMFMEQGYMLFLPDLIPQLVGEVNYLRALAKLESKPEDQETKDTVMEDIVFQLLEPEYAKAKLAMSINLEHLKASDTPLYPLPLEPIFEKDTAEYQNSFYDLVEKVWLPYYDEMYRPFGYNFRHQYERLLNAWRLIANNLKELEPATRLLVALCRYPLNIPQDRDIVILPDSLCAIISELADEPMKRLEKLVIAVENSTELHTSEEWASYMFEKLPDLSSTAKKYLTPWRHVESMWASIGEFELAKDFGSIYKFMRMHNAWIDNLPLYRPEIFDTVVRPVPGSNRSHNYMLVPLTLESMRQWLIVMRQLLVNKENSNISGPCCFCDSAIRDACETKYYLKLVWESVIADRGYKRKFSKHWQKPICV